MTQNLCFGIVSLLSLLICSLVRFICERFPEQCSVIIQSCAQISF